MRSGSYHFTPQPRQRQVRSKRFNSTTIMETVDVCQLSSTVLFFGFVFFFMVCSFAFLYQSQLAKLQTVLLLKYNLILTSHVLGLKKPQLFIYILCKILGQMTNSSYKLCPHFPVFELSYAYHLMILALRPCVLCITWKHL